MQGVTKVDGVMKNKFACALLSVALVAGLCPTVAFGQEQPASASPDVAMAASDVAALATGGAAADDTSGAASMDARNESPAIGGVVAGPNVCGTCTWSVDGEGTLTVRPAEGDVGVLDDWGSGPSPLSGRQDVKRVAFEGTVKAVTCSGLFAACENLEEVDLTNLDTSEVASMRGMFDGCKKLKSVNFLNHNVRKVSDVSRMFAGCGSLEQVRFYSVDYENRADFVLENAEWRPVDMAQMFLGCSSLQILNLVIFATGGVEDMSETFSGCSSLTSIFASFDWSTENVKRGQGTFSGCTALSGNAGTAYDESHTDYTYARLDHGAFWRSSDTPGYLTHSVIDLDDFHCAIPPAHWPPIGGGDENPSDKVDGGGTGGAAAKAGVEAPSVQASKAANTLLAKAKAGKVTKAKLKKKARKLSLISVSGACGKVSYQKLSGSSRLKVDKSSGKVTVKKGTKKGIYTMKVRVSAAGDASHEAASKIVTVKVTVKPVFSSGRNEEVA